MSPAKHTSQAVLPAVALLCDSPNLCRGAALGTTGGFCKVIFAVGGINPRSIILKIPKKEG